MDEKNKLVIELLKDIKKQFEKNGYYISEETYYKYKQKYINSDMSLEEIKYDLMKLVEEKIFHLKKEKESKKILEDYQNEILTIESLDRYGYPNIINANIKVLSKVDTSYNNVKKVTFGNKEGFYKNSANTTSFSFDKFEFIIVQIGKMLNVKMAEVYKVKNGNVSLGIISENVCKDYETLYMYSEITKFINKDNYEVKEVTKSLKDISRNKVKIKSNNHTYEISVASSKNEIGLVLSSFLTIVNALNINSDDKRRIREDYFKMIMLDFLTGNVDRSKNNYGLIISEYGEVNFAPLFDNATIDMPGFPNGYQQINGFLLKKSDLLNYLYANYYDDIKSITDTCVKNRDTLNNKVFDLSSKELDTEEQSWFLSKFNQNLNMIIDKEISMHTELKDEANDPEKEIAKESEELKLVRINKENNKVPNNSGKINLILIILSISLVLILTTLTILFKIY